MNIIKLDIDKPYISMQNANRIIKVKNILGLDIIDIDIHKSTNGNYHILIEVLNPINDYEIICIQILMLSDYKRECFNLLRIHSNKFISNGVEWNVLFTHKL